MKRLEREHAKVLMYNPACWAHLKQTFLPLTRRRCSFLVPRPRRRWTLVPRPKRYDGSSGSTGYGRCESLGE